MKVIIAEINKKYSIAISHNGDFIKIRSKSFYSVGAVVDLSEIKNFKFRTKTRFISVVAALIFVFTLSIGTYAYYRPYNYINIDINPSIEVVTNIFNKTIGIKALNEDGKKILSTIKYSSDNVDECVKLILDIAVLNGYMPPAKSNAVMITVSNNDNNSTENLNRKLENIAETEMEKINVDAVVYVESATMKTHDNAVNSGKTVGKQIILEELRKVDPSATIKDIENTPVIIIMEKIDVAKKAIKIRKINKITKTNNEKNTSNTSTTRNTNTKTTERSTTDRSTTATDKSRKTDNLFKKANLEKSTKKNKIKIKRNRNIKRHFGLIDYYNSYQK